MSEKTKIALACFLGAAIGTMVSWELDPWLCLIGLPLGAAIGYLSYDWREVIAKAPAAYRAARGWVPGEKAKMRAWVAAATVSSALWTFGLAMFVLWCMARNSKESVLSAVAGAEFFMILFGALIAIVGMTIEEDSSSRTERECARHLAIVMFPPVTVYHGMRGIGWLLPRIPGAFWTALRFSWRTGCGIARFFGRFAWKLFLALMSEARLISMLGAAAGSLCGLFAGLMIKSSGQALPLGLPPHAAGAVLSLACGALGVGCGLLFRYVVVSRLLEPRGYIRNGA